MEKYLPVGVENFSKLRISQNFYIDKTKFIADLLRDKFEVYLINRPHRFGKTLAMSMLADFFDIRKDSKAIFEGLEISKYQELCNKWMNRYPVLFLTLKNIEALHFEDAYDLFAAMASDLCIEHAYLAKSNNVDVDDLQRFLELKAQKASKATVQGSLFLLSRMLKAHYGKPAIILIDEYDVPLARASEQGYYEQMLDMMRGFLGKALKTNPALAFAVITGCLRIAKESIFMGTNNFVSDSISKERYSRYFGFTEEEVNKLLKETGFEEKAEEVKKWYNGYCFGNAKVYCPWDVLNYIRELQATPDILPENYWRNTSHNGIIRSFIDRVDLQVQEKFERLLLGDSILEEITEELTYDIVHSSESNLWSILYLTGYLTKDISKQAQSPKTSKEIYLKIPNEEVKSIFSDTIAVWFADCMKNTDRKALFDAFWNGEEKIITEMVGNILFSAISYFDYKEDYYHAFLAGLFAGAGYAVESNKEYGLGRPDVVIRDRNHKRVIIIEVKHAKTEEGMAAAAKHAFEQIDTKKYAQHFLKGYHTILCYGAAFFEKNCVIEKYKK
uniref:AAA family ATPase n=1 Tax=Agathobacter sp. TaxID=2021311 RepID=UPI004057ADC0